MLCSKTGFRKTVSVFLAIAAMTSCVAAKTYSKQEINQILSKLQQEIKEKGYQYTVGPTSVIGFSMDELCGVDPAKEQANLAPPEPTSQALQKSLSLPSAFDWNAQGKCTPIRNQGLCLSCWAFASIGSYESALLIFNSTTADLSEEYLVFCSPQGYGCNVGGYCAFTSMAAGTPLESCAPYLGSQQGCQCPKYYPIQASYSVDTSVASIKQAIYSHGGVYATVAATNAFMAYTGGVFNNNDPLAQTNHAIVLVGWDDTKKAWRLRNSWGTGWGESGYMWIAYGCLKVGLGAQYAVPTGTNPQLAAPSNLAATTVSLSQINLSWKNNASSVSGFYIERKAGTGAYSQIASVGPTAVSYTNTALTANTVYTYRVRTYTTKLTSDYSNEASALTTTLSAPSNLTATTASPAQINLAWKNNASVVAGFYIERSIGSGAFSQIAFVGPSVCTYANTGLTANTTYSYRVRAFTASMFSNYSNMATAVTANIPAPTNLTAQFVNASLVMLSWRESSPTVSGFYVESKIGTGSYGQIAIEPYPVQAVAVALLNPGTTFTFRVRAYSNLLTSGYSNEVSVTTLNITAPTNLVAAKASSTQINLSWKNNAAAGTLAGFYIERQAGSGAFTPIASVGPTTTTFSNIGLTSKTTYYYRVRAYNAYLYSGYSNVATLALGSSVGVALLFIPGSQTFRSLTITDARGVCVVQTSYKGQLSAKELRSVAHLAPGFYIARLRDGASMEEQRFTVFGGRTGNAGY